MNMTAILIVLIIFGAITAIIFGPTYLKSREKRDIQQTMRHAIDNGQQLPADLIDVMTRDVASKLPSRTRDLRRGVMWLAVGVGFALFATLIDVGASGWEGDDFPFGGFGQGIAAIPATIGLAFILLSFFNPNKE